VSWIQLLKEFLKKAANDRILTRPPGVCQAIIEAWLRVAIRRPASREKIGVEKFVLPDVEGLKLET